MRDTGRDLGVPLWLQNKWVKGMKCKETILPCFYNLFSNIANNILLWFPRYFYMVVAVFSFWISLIWEFSVSFFVVKLNGQFYLSLQREPLEIFWHSLYFLNYLFCLFLFLSLWFLLSFYLISFSQGL